NTVIDTFRQALSNALIDGETYHHASDIAFLLTDMQHRSYELQMKGTDSALAALDSRYKDAEKTYQSLSPSLPADVKTQTDTLWRYIGQYMQLNTAYYAALNDVKKTENDVMKAGTRSSADIKSLITVVKAKNDELAYNSATITMIIGLIAVIIGIIISIYITRIITRPIIHNLSLAERIASGDLTTTIHTDRHDELGRLTHAMGTMNEQLRHVISEVRDSV
ncbi:HAMP domain-containing protein, partial [Dickeya dadantii]|nr:HAMP domain-containing protein [Dickeya dadantii]